MNFDEPNFEHLLILAPSQSVVEQSFSESELLAFFDDGHNIFVAGDMLTKKYTRNLVKQFGMEIYPQDNVLSDGQSTPSDYDSISSSVRDDVILSQNVWSPVSKTVTSITKPVIFNGVGFDIDENNEYAFPILKASALTHNSDERIKATGEDINLVGGYQSRLNS